MNRVVWLWRRWGGVCVSLWHISTSDLLGSLSSLHSVDSYKETVLNAPLLFSYSQWTMLTLSFQWKSMEQFTRYALFKQAGSIRSTSHYCTNTHTVTRVWPEHHLHDLKRKWGGLQPLWIRIQTFYPDSGLHWKHWAGALTVLQPCLLMAPSSRWLFQGTDETLAGFSETAGHQSALQRMLCPAHWCPGDSGGCKW